MILQEKVFEFVTRKISKGVAMVKLGLLDKIKLGNLEVKRNWGYAPEYVKAMYLLLPQEKPEDYVIAIGETHSVKEFVELGFKIVNPNWGKYVEIDKTLFRPAEVYELRGNITKIKIKLEWHSKVKFEELVRIMVENDLKKLKKI